MKLALSTLALPPGDSTSLWPDLAALGATGLEIAPKQLWPLDWTAPSAAQVQAAAAAAWRAALPVIGLQNILGDQDALNPLLGPESHRAALACAKRAAAVCRDLGGRTVGVDAVRPADLSERAALTLWRDFLSRLAAEIEDYEVLVCLTPRAPTATDRGLSFRDCYILANAVDHPAISLALRASALTPHNEFKHATFAVGRGRLEHFVLDEAHLTEVGAAGPEGLDHPDLRRHLAAERYRYWISVTQAHRPQDADPLAALRRAAQFVSDLYLIDDWRGSV